MISKLRAPGELTDKSRPSRELQVQLIEVKFGGSASWLNGETLTELQILVMRQACHSFQYGFCQRPFGFKRFFKPDVPSNRVCVNVKLKFLKQHR